MFDTPILELGMTISVVRPRVIARGPTARPSPLDAATRLSGGRVRIPTRMLADGEHYSALAIALFAWIEKLDDATAPAYAGRKWYAERLKSSVPAVARALAALSAPTPVPRVVSFQDSPYVTADRWTTSWDGDPYVQVPAWVLRLIEPGTLSVRAFRLYCGYLSLRQRNQQAVRVTNVELAAASGLGVDAVPRYRRECEAAGLLLVLDDGRGREATVVPMLAETTPEQRDELTRLARSACGQLRRDGTSRRAESSTASRETDLVGSRESDTPPSSETHARESDRAKPPGEPDIGVWTTVTVDELCRLRDLQTGRVLRAWHRRDRERADADDEPPPPSSWYRPAYWDRDTGCWRVR